jgi:hypothetical protein
MFDQRRALGMTLGFLFLLVLPLSGQQDYVSRYNLYTGYAFLDSPKLQLFENGFHTQFGYRVKTWLDAGFDYSVTAGDQMVTPGLLTIPLQQQLGAALAALAAAGQLPPGYAVRVPTHATTNSFALGPQLVYRHFMHVTIFARPSIGAVREAATLHPTDPIATAIAAQLVPSGHVTDWAGFYGAGAGFDILFTKHIGLRSQVDYVHEHLFSNLLREGRWTTRFSVGPTFNFGKNIRE